MWIFHNLCQSIIKNYTDMSILKKLPLLCGKKSRTIPIVFHSFKRHYPKIDPASIDRCTDSENVKLHSQLADQWWDPRRNPLHALNEIRVPFIRNCILNAGTVCTTNTNRNVVLKGLKVLDVGCGGGILSEAFGRLRCDVVGIDASAELIEVAKEHAKRDKNVEKHVRYENTDLPHFSKQHTQEFDLVILSEVLEHVSDKEYFLKLCANCLKDEGSLFITTPNRNFLSKLFLINLSEFMNIVPYGTHDYNKFITPRELALLLRDLNCITRHVEGIVYWPLSRRFDVYRYTHFMYALHAMKNTNRLEIDVFQDDRLSNFCS